MTERQFLDRQSRRVRDRIRRASASLQAEIERAAGPAVREHPRLSLAASASVGLLLGRVMAASPPRSRSPSRPRRGLIAGALRFLGGTTMFALRSKIVSALAGSPRTGEATSAADSEAHSGE